MLPVGMESLEDENTLVSSDFIHYIRRFAVQIFFSFMGGKI